MDPKFSLFPCCPAGQILGWQGWGKGEELPTLLLTLKFAGPGCDPSVASGQSLRVFLLVPREYGVYCVYPLWRCTGVAGPQQVFWSQEGTLLQCQDFGVHPMPRHGPWGSSPTTRAAVPSPCSVTLVAFVQQLNHDCSLPARWKLCWRGKLYSV